MEIGVESSLAAYDRANAAFIAVLSKTPASVALISLKGVDDCTEELLGETLEEFRLKCVYGREASVRPRMMTDKQLEAQGCLTRAEAETAGCTGLFRNCQEPLPKSESQIADADMVACLIEDGSRTEYLYVRLYELFRGDELERRLEDLNPGERNSVRDQNVPTDF